MPENRASPQVDDWPSPARVAVWLLASFALSSVSTTILFQAVRGFGPLRHAVVIVAALLVTAALARAFGIVPGSWERWLIAATGTALIAISTLWSTMLILFIACLLGQVLGIQRCILP